MKDVCVKFLKNLNIQKCNFYTFLYLGRNSDIDFTNDVAKMIANKTKDFYKYILNCPSLQKE